MKTAKPRQCDEKGCTHAAAPKSAYCAEQWNQTRATTGAAISALVAGIKK